MTYLNELKPGEFARIVEIDYITNSINSSDSVGLLEGCFIKIVSCFGNIVFKSDRKTFVISKNFAEKIRVVIINSNKS